MGRLRRFVKLVAFGLVVAALIDQLRRDWEERTWEGSVAGIVPVIRPFEDPVPDQAPKLDLITLVLNYHDITYLPVDRARMNQKLFAALKPGGHFVVIDHSAKAGADISVGKSLHRIDQAIVHAEQAKLREKMKPVIDKYAGSVGEGTVKDLMAELNRVRK